MQDFKIRAFSSLEIIITIVIVSIILSFSLPKLNTFLDKNHLLKLKSDIVLIKSALQEYRTKKVIAQEDSYIISLDNAKIDTENEELFADILNLPVLSTTIKKGKSGYWAKASYNQYIFFTPSNTYEFVLKEGEFICISKDKICKELE